MYYTMAETNFEKMARHSFLTTKKFYKILKLAIGVTAILHLTNIFIYKKGPKLSSTNLRKCGKMKEILAPSAQQEAKCVIWYHHTGPGTQIQHRHTPL